MLYAFDLDGVLVDTQEANRRAYLSIGTTPPPDFHQRPWQEWTDAATHDRKNTELPRFRDLIKILPLIELVWKILPDVRIISMCSQGAYDLLIEKEPIFREVLQGLTRIGIRRDYERLAVMKDYNDTLTYYNSIPR